MNRDLFLYSFIHYKLSADKTGKLEKAKIKEVIGRTLVRAGGIPRYSINYVIEDLCKLKLIKKINNKEGYLILENPYINRLKVMLYLG